MPDEKSKFNVGDVGVLLERAVNGKRVLIDAVRHTTDFGWLYTVEGNDCQYGIHIAKPEDVELVLKYTVLKAGVS